jgi:hypothetical protein
MSWFNFVLVLQTCVLVFYPPSCTPMPLQRGTGLISYVLRQQAVAHLQILDFLHTGSKNSTLSLTGASLLFSIAGLLHSRPSTVNGSHLAESAPMAGAATSSTPPMKRCPQAVCMSEQRAGMPACQGRPKVLVSPENLAAPTLARRFCSHGKVLSQNRLPRAHQCSISR